MSTIQARINDAVKDAMRAKDKERLGTLRLATAEFKKVEVDERITLDDAELDELIRNAIADTGAGGMKDMGKVMAALKPQVQGRTDMGALSQKIQSLLG